MNRVQRREAAGTPIGGRFATDAGARSDVELSDTVIRNAVDAMDQAARRAVSRYRNIEADDLRSETMVQFLAKARADTAKAREWNSDPDQVAPYATVMVRNLAWRMANPTLNSKQRVARKNLALAVSDFSSDHGRAPTTLETRSLAEAVRSKMPASMRPGADYWQIDTRPAPPPDATERDHAAGDAAAIAEVLAVDAVLAERDRAVAIAGGRKAAEGTLSRTTYRGVEAMYRARGHALPDIAPLSRSRAEGLSRTLVEGGGTDAVCARWQAGTTTTAEETALFAPWGRELRFAQQEAVVTVLRDLGAERAAVAWKSALANARHVDGAAR